MTTKIKLAIIWNKFYGERFPSNYAGVWRAINR